MPPTAADSACRQAISALGGVSTEVLDALQERSGYLFQAHVFSAVGRSLESLHSWTWVHPTGGPTFASGAGGTLQAARGRSWLKKPDGTREFVQELTFKGRSGAGHYIDLACVEAAGGGTNQVEFVHVAIECKHRAETAGLGIARELLGQLSDLGSDLPPFFPYVVLASGGAVSQPAQTFLNHYQIGCLANAAPMQTVQVHELRMAIASS